METELNFTYDAEKKVYKASFVSCGCSNVCQVDGKADRVLVVYANIPGMEPVIIHSFVKGSANTIFNVAVPEGVEITITSSSEVSSAKVITE